MKLEKPVNIAGFFINSKKHQDLTELEVKMVQNLSLNETVKEEIVNQDIEPNFLEKKSEINESDNDETYLSTNYDDEAWITPINLEKVKKINQTDSGEKIFIDQTIPVGCITSDFSMQVNK